MPSSTGAIFLNLLDTEWLPAIPDVDRRLRAEARAEHVPAAPAGRARGLVAADAPDLDEDVIVVARANAETGVRRPLTFSVADASDPDCPGRSIW